MVRTRTARWRAFIGVAATALVLALVSGGTGSAVADPSGQGATATPIKHLVVIFQENVSFDHYFGTYPSAAYPAGEPAFHASPGPPPVTGLYNSVGPSGP